MIRLLALLFGFTSKVGFTLPLDAQPDTRAVAQRIAAANERYWPDWSKPVPSTTSRALFAYALVLCEADQNLDRLDRIFDLAAQMQDRDPNSKSYGNFKWKWDDQQIVDYNAVDFSMRGGSLLWLKHKAKIPAAAREKLRELLEFSAEGLMRHRVSEAYTNIALMNSSDLILLGEAMGKSNVAEEGYKRFERTLLYTYEFGIHEYVSPTYYGPDLDALVMVERYAQRERGVQQARAFLEFFWTDIALNWFAPAQRLAGAHSRSYDYLSALGELDKHMQWHGWVPGEATNIDMIYTAQGRWVPSPEIKKLNEQYPRLVRQRWGVEQNQWRTHFVQRDVTLSTAGQYYGGRMDFPLTVDFPGDRKSVRCYFVADGRGDPYGKIRIAESATHSKALHLNYFWAGAQNENSALGLVMYRDQHIPPESEVLESHFVMPLDNDGVWIGDKKITFEKGKAATFPVAPDDYVILRKGSAALGVRAFWTRDVKGQNAPANLVYDGNNFGAIRLTVTHYRGEKIGEIKQGDNLAGAAFTVSIGSGLRDDVKADNDFRNFAVWKKFPLDEKPSERAFATKSVFMNRSLIIPSTGPPVPAHVWIEWKTLNAVLMPSPSPMEVLALNHDEIGKNILKSVEPIKSAAGGANVPQLNIANTGVYFEAESGAVMPAFEIADDANASGGKYVWMPGEAGKGGGSALGSMTWKVDLAQRGEFYLWGCVMASTPDDDSFFVRVMRHGADVLSATTWSIGTHDKWEWVRFPEKISLPQGENQLQLRVREDGAKIDRLFITRDANEVPN